MEIVNLSFVSLTDEQTHVLKLGLTFCPSTDLDRFQLIKDIHLFARRLLFKIIYDKPSVSEPSDSPPLELSDTELQALDDLMQLWEEGHTSDAKAPLPSCGVVVPGVSFPPPVPFRPKSCTFPSLQINPNIWAFVQQTAFEIENMDLEKLHTHNLSSRHRKALQDLQCHPDLVIKQADKGGNVMDVPAYKRMCLDILDNRHWYHPISKTLIQNFTSEYYGLIFEAYQLGTIDLSTWNYLNVKDPKIPTFYSLPKVHKSLQQPPG